MKKNDKSTDAMLNSQEEEEDEGDSGAEEIGKLLTIHNFSFFFFSFVSFSYEEKISLVSLNLPLIQRRGDKFKVISW